MAAHDSDTTFRLERFVPRLVLDWVTDEPDCQWRSVEGTMMFADISGFTALSERLATRGRIGTEELVETLSRVFGGMLEITARRGGQLLKFGGDALLLLFTGDDHARQAASAAVEMRRDLRRASQIPTSVGRLKLAISIGAHSGSFHLFLVGDRYRQLVLAGPETTLAMECESAADAGQIVVSEQMASLLGAGSTTPRGDGQLVVTWRTGVIDRVRPPVARATDVDAARSVTPPNISSVLENGAPDPIHRVATIAFFKFKGTDQLLEAVGPDALADALHRTLSVAEAAFDAEEIELLQVDADANGGKFFCSSGVLRTSEDDEGRMLRAARAIIEADPPLQLQVGIHRGHVFAGELGLPDQAAYSSMGDTTNTAARIMVTAPPGEIHAHPAVLEAARVRYDAEPRGPFTFKGKAQPQMVYRVGEELGPREATDGHLLRMRGREAELAALRASVDAAAQGQGNVVTLIGAAGLGKSRLLREALGSDHPPTVEMHAEPYGSTNSYRVLRDPLRGLLGLDQRDGDALARSLTAIVREHAPHHERFLPLIGDALQISIPPTEESAAIAPRFRADRTADVVLDVIGTLHDGPLVFVAEDMHWADDASAHLLERIAATTDSRPWLLICVRRDDEGGFRTERGIHLPVEPLPDDTIRAVTIEATEAAPLRPHEIDLVVKRSAGSPLFVGELVTAAQELGSLDAVPESLQGTLAAQVDALDSLSKRVLSRASVLGRSFRRSVVDEVLRQEGLVLDQATITQLGRFIEADGPDRYRFKNGLVCDVVYDGLAFRSRARFHEEAGDAIEALSDGAEIDSAMLSLHFSKAGDAERTYRYATVAAERADRTYVASEAAVHYERAVDAARRLDGVSRDELRLLLVALGDARQHSGLFDAALDAYRRASAVAGDDVVARAEIHLRRARVRERAGAYSLALGETTRGRSLASTVADVEAGEAMEARLLAHAAIVRSRQSHAAQARSLGLAAADLAERHGEHAALARAYHAIFLAETLLGGTDKALWARRALDLYEAIGDIEGQAEMTNNLGVIAYFDSRWDETVTRYEQAIDADRRIGNLLDASLTAANIGEVLVNQGRLDEAEPLLRDAARVVRASDYGAAPFVEMHLGRLLTAQGDFGEAERLLRAGVEQWRASGRAASAYEMSVYLADCLVRSGRPHEGLDILERATGADAGEIAIFQAAAALVEATAFIELERVDEATAAICRGVRAARERSLTFDLARLLLLAGDIGPPFDRCLGTPEPAEEARRLLDRLGVLHPDAARA
ncbi:adenylate/guanylate cyclase domain-containing protein [Ilumatobacter sp.]|uniref:adenylate/guanylate cyclase domain-containing protein n=1 Tax=Ilumatobacter sp. TaxID=1967498 RepID=UPI003C3BFCF8